MENWDDLRIFLATARAGSARAGARDLGVNQSTISRRIAQLEERSGVRLFDRRPGGLVLTDAGDELLALASEVEERVAAVDRRLQGRDAELRGPLRLSLPDFMVVPVAASLAEFAARYPQIDLEVIVDNGLVRLSHREADVVLRLAASPPEHLVGRRLAQVWLAVYGSVATLGDRPVDPLKADWVRWDEPWRQIPPERWIDANIAPERIRARVNTSLAHAELVAEGVGVGFQICYTAEVDPRLCRLAPPMDLGVSLWLLTHQDLMRTGRVRALLRSLGDALSVQRARFEVRNTL